MLALLLLLAPAFAAHAHSVVAGCYPVYVTLLNLTRDVEGVSVGRVGEAAGGCPHERQLSAADWRRLERADLVVLNGAGLEPFADKLDPAKVVDASADIVEPGDNPHLWLAVGNAQLQAMTVSEALVRLDPGHAALYRRNARDYAVRLLDLRERMARLLDPVRDRSLVICGDAFGLLAKDFGFAARELETPLPRELADAVKEIRAGGKRCVLATDEGLALARTLANETGVAIVTLDAVVSGPDGDPDAYINAMLRNAALIRGADAGMAAEDEP